MASGNPFWQGVVGEKTGKYIRAILKRAYFGIYAENKISYITTVLFSHLREKN